MGFARTAVVSSPLDRREPPPISSVIRRPPSECTSRDSTSRDRRAPVDLVLLEELPLEVVRVAEGDHGELAGSIQLDSVRVGADATQHDLQLVERLTSTARPDGDVIEADPALVEPVALRSSG